jgi:hypothetical protein
LAALAIGVQANCFEKAPFLAKTLKVGFSAPEAGCPKVARLLRNKERKEREDPECPAAVHLEARSQVYERPKTVQD